MYGNVADLLQVAACEGGEAGDGVGVETHAVCVCGHDGGRISKVV